MTRLYSLLLISMFAMTVQATEGRAEWSTAVATRPSDGHRMVYRYRSEFNQSFKRSSFPDRVTIAWHYKSSNGMPVATEREAMDRLEDLLSPHVEQPSFSSLVIVSTGENLREWTYYTRSQQEFLAKVNEALRNAPRFPIEIDLWKDPEWKAYEDFRRSVTKVTSPNPTVEGSCVNCRVAPSRLSYVLD
jgi:hypothetical protein